MRKAKKFLVSILALASISSLAVGAILATPKTAASAETTEGLTYSYAYDASKGSNWINAEVNLPDELIKGGVADMTSVKAMVYEVDNSEQPAFCYTLGIWDADHTAFDDQWHMDNTGSALYVPEKGHPYWASTHWVPAGFKGTVVLPWCTTSYDWTANTRYKAINNPVFKTRYSKNNTNANTAEGKEMGKGIYYTDGSVGTFPTARMQTKMTFYVHNDWNKLTENITFSNIRFVENYDEYLKKAETYDCESIGEVSNQIPLEGAIGFNSAAQVSMTYKMQSGGGTTVTSLDNNVGLAFRMKNMSSETIKLEVKINETSSEVMFLSYAKEIDLPFIHTDGRVDTIKGQGTIQVPAGYDGTVIIPNTAWALAQNPNKPADLNGRLHGEMWAFFWYAHAIGVEQTFAIAEVNQIYASYNAETDKTEYTLKPMKTATNGVDVNYVKNVNSWQTSTGTQFVVAGSRAVSVTETENGVESQTARTTLSKNALYYNDVATVTMPVETGLEIGSVLVNGADVTADIVAGEGAYTYSFKNGELNSTEAVAIAVNYVSSYAETEYYVGGASVRYDWTNADKTGIRFQMLIKKEIYDSLVEKYGENFSTGTLIIPEDKLGGAELTKQTASVDDTDTTGKWSVKTIGGEEYMESWTYLYGIPEHSYNRGLSARGYLDLNGTIVYTDNTIVRSLAGVAYAEKNMEGVSQEKVEMLNKYLKTYTVQFADENGEVYSTIASQNVVYGEKISVPTEPTKDGFVFAGWTLNGKPFNPATDSVKGNMVLKATFVAA